jgi:hypothetical protein
VTRQEAGRIGGLVTAALYGRSHMAEIGSRGFAAYANRYHGGNRARARRVLGLDGTRRRHRPDPDAPWKHHWLTERGG